ncbi:DEHA2D04994p [Debaryomyces hansenii CBS767]|uniref:DEHA2D04994p n=1 Tax=Debaryomyces hansenii (strain ATCC 36239 / CBS 767 / BCRC 21394 / JCM 1990 / NBRC 0083 / IGC 2968) TaxID=284592 RepID=Q6BSY7_DEBHA|nr:DEHA2D04994p [Debaryomyces hansenii CBS767]CAG86822.2 DEHA2D04994p [Debaryomyces hansenii CBS767]|eukprot:XP_458683.2 DEHA2D04994p [Debaryomyces hansenii CBS767]
MSSKFDNSPFHREGKSAYTKPKPKPKSKDSEFIQELVETGRANWKKAPKAVKTRYYGIYMIMFSIPVILIPSYEIYRRLEGKSTKRVQEGELLEGNEVRKFDEVEKWQVEKNSLMYKIFGRDFFLDGFTSRTMNPEKNNEKDSK